MVKLSDIVSYFKDRGLALSVKSDFDIEISGGKNIGEADQGEITFIGKKYINKIDQYLGKVRASLVIVDMEIADKTNLNSFGINYVIASDAKKEMVECLKYFFLKEPIPSISETSSIAPDAKIGARTHVSQYVVIENDVCVGEDCIIEPCVYLKSGTRVGNRVIIKAGTIIGGTGFGYVRQENGSWEKFPHFGKVIIEDDVHIGSNTCIDRGALGNTIIKKGVKIDNLVHVAHNVSIGENSLVIANSIIGGSTEIGENAWIAPSATLRNGIKIGKDVVIGMAAVVTKQIDDGVTVIGNPAKPMEKK